MSNEVIVRVIEGAVEIKLGGQTVKVIAGQEPAPPLVVERRDVPVSIEAISPSWVGLDDEPTKRKFAPRRACHTLIYTAFGETKTAHDWAKDPRCKVGYEVLRNRVYRGWPVEQSILTPLQFSRREDRAASA